MKEKFNLNKKAKYLNFSLAIITILSTILCSFIGFWYIPFIIGTLIILSITILDILVCRTMDKINSENEKIINKNTKNYKMGKIPLKDYTKLMKGEGIILEDGTPIFKKDIKD